MSRRTSSRSMRTTDPVTIMPSSTSTIEEPYISSRASPTSSSTIGSSASRMPLGGPTAETNSSEASWVAVAADAVASALASETSLVAEVSEGVGVGSDTKYSLGVDG
jgi:hypothetical protein